MGAVRTVAGHPIGRCRATRRLDRLGTVTATRGVTAMRRAVLRPLGAVAVTAMMAALAAAPAQGSSTDELPVRLTSFERIVADEDRGRLFLTTGRDGQDDLLVLGLDGALERQLPVPGAEAVVVHDGAVYVSQPRLGTIAVLDAGTLEPLAPIALGAGICPRDLAVTGDRLVFGHADCATGRGSGGIGVVDLTGTATVRLSTAGPWYDPVLATSPGAPGLVVAGDAGLSPTSLYVLDVSGADPLLVTRRADTGSNLRDLAVSPAGGSVVSAQGHPYVHQVMSVPGLEVTSTLASGAYPNAAAWSGDGRTVVVGSDGADPAVRVWDVVEGGERNWLPLADGRYLQDRGLAVSRDGRTVWAVTGDVYGRGLSLVVERDDTAPTELWVGTPAAVYANEEVTVHGSLSFRDWASTDGKVVEVTRTVVVDAVVTTTRLPDVDASLGDFRFSDVPPAGQVSWTVTYPGDPVHPAASASTQPLTLVERAVATLTVEAPATGTVGEPLRLTGTLTSGTAAIEGAEVTVARRVADGEPLPVASTTTTPNGAWSVTDVPATAGETVYIASYAPPGVAPVIATATTSVAPAPAPVITLTAPATASVGEDLPLLGTLRRNGSALVGAPVALSAQTPGAAPVDLGVATTNEDGVFQLSHVPAGAGEVTYTATYAPKDGTAPVSATARTVVQRVATVLTVTAEAGSGRNRRVATVTATLMPFSPTAVVRITATPEQGPSRVVAEEAVGSDGAVTTAVDLGKGTTTFTATFAGDARFAPSSGSTTLRR